MIRQGAIAVLATALAISSSAIAQNQPRVVKHVTVIKETNKFAGWPANNGMHSWGDEIVVGFTLGTHDDDKLSGHPIKDPRTLRQARSLDGGETWTVEKPSFLDESENEREPTELPAAMNFEHPDFALRFRSQKGSYYYSTDRCKTWNGPYIFPDFGRPGILARTDYIVNGKLDMYVFSTSEKDNGREGWPFCARTTDGGRTWQHVGWIGKQPPIQNYGYAIMPSTVRLDNGAFLSFIRHGGEFNGQRRWWLDTHLSPDQGKSWYKLDQPDINNGGNPAAALKLADGRIVLTYGWRHAPYGLRAMLSSDQGQTWTNEIVLRHDGDSWDIGYPRSVQRPDGNIVTVIYFKDDSSKERYIAATIWNPGIRPQSTDTEVQ